MSLDQMRAEIAWQENAGLKHVMLVTPLVGFKPPPKFPRGEVMCVTELGRVQRFPLDKLKKWLAEISK